MAERVAAALVAELSTEERQRLGRRQTESLEAYQAYCRGRFFWGRFSRPWVEKAMLMLSRSHGPRPPLCTAARGPRRRVPGRRFRGGALPPREAWALAEESSRQALALDDRPPGAPRLGGLPPPLAGLGLGRRRARSCGAPIELAPDVRGTSPVARSRPRPSRPRRRSGPDAAPGRGAGPTVAGGFRPGRPAPRVRRRARG